ncbi:MAG: helix-turn-helix domain-containing protein [Nitriliruptorales bacterium]|nr:helix-turn-helix domain-containing protein [Nitriliruptorales bacterium]
MAEAPTDELAPVAQRLLDDLDRLVPRMGASYRTAIPSYAQIDERLFETEVLRTSRAAVVIFCERVLAGQDMDAIDDSDFRWAGRRRLQMGITLEDSLHAFRLAARVVWEDITGTAGPTDGRVVATLAGLWLQYIDRISTAFAEGYVNASHEQLRRIDAQRRELVDALLAVDPADAAGLAARFGITLARRYAPVLLAGEHVTANVDAVAATLRDGGFVGHRGGGLLVLASADSLDASVLRLAARADLAIVGEPTEIGSPLRSEVTLVERLLEAAVAAGRKDSVLGLEDLFVEHLARSSDRVRDALRSRVLAPLATEDRDGTFVATLAAFLRSGSVPMTAAGLHVHANTVLYRLKRITEITGLDPRVPADAAVLLLAAEVNTDDTAAPEEQP